MHEHGFTSYRQFTSTDGKLVSSFGTVGKSRQELGSVCFWDRELGSKCIERVRQVRNGSIRMVLYLHKYNTAVPTKWRV